MSKRKNSTQSRSWRDVARDLGNETSRLRVIELSEELNHALGMELYEELNHVLEKHELSLVPRTVTSTKSAGRVLQFPMAKP